MRRASRPRSATRFGRRASPPTSQRRYALEGRAEGEPCHTRATQFYDRRAEEVTLDDVQRILCSDGAPERNEQPCEELGQTPPFHWAIRVTKMRIRLNRSAIFFGCLLASDELSPARATSIVAKLEKSGSFSLPIHGRIAWKPALLALSTTSTTIVAKLLILVRVVLL